MKPLSPDARAERRLAIGLALITGYVDAYGLRAFATYVSFMSGNTTQTGSITGQGHLVAALPSSLAIVFFVGGFFAGTLLTHSGPRHSRQLMFGVVAALLAVDIGLMQLASSDSKGGIETLSLSMGIMNTALSRVGVKAASLTLVTGTLNRIGRHLAPGANHLTSWTALIACLLVDCARRRGARAEARAETAEEGRRETV